MPNERSTALILTNNGMRGLVPMPQATVRAAPTRRQAFVPHFGVLRSNRTHYVPAPAPRQIRMGDAPVEYRGQRDGRVVEILSRLFLSEGSDYAFVQDSSGRPHVAFSENGTQKVRTYIDRMTRLYVLMNELTAIDKELARQLRSPEISRRWMALEEKAGELHGLIGTVVDTFGSASNVPLNGLGLSGLPAWLLTWKAAAIISTSILVLLYSPWPSWYKPPKPTMTAIMETVKEVSQWKRDTLALKASLSAAGALDPDTNAIIDASYKQGMAAILTTERGGGDDGWFPWGTVAVIGATLATLYGVKYVWNKTTDFSSGIGALSYSPAPTQISVYTSPPQSQLAAGYASARKPRRRGATTKKKARRKP